MGQAASHALVAAADLQPPLTMGVSGLERALGEAPQHERLLGSTRFMKTILCRVAGEGQLVLRVFMRPASAAAAGAVGRQIDGLRAAYGRLEGAQRAVGRARVVSDERAVYILRQYLHNNLYDRVSTRPFLSGGEKRWVAAQLLMALREAHGRGVCHGDVKSENVVMTSWGLAYLADFAPFKPAYLPADDPAEFNFYFDAAARQCCCVAPERFYDPGSAVAQRLAGDGAAAPALEPSMDVFSAGCVIAELFRDGNPLFSLSRLLQYRAGALAADALVGDIPDPDVAALVRHMIQLDPAQRLTAAEYLERWAGVFPTAPAAAYMDRASAGARMRALHAEVAAMGDRVPDQLREITAAVACAAARNCRRPSARCAGIKVLVRCCRGAGDASVVVDAALPYLVALAADPSPRVRAEAVVAIRDVVAGLARLAPINVNLFDDYVAPHLQVVAGDASSMVRCMVAGALGDVADAAHHVAGSDPALGPALAGQLRAMVARLSFDEAAEVRHVLLCSFPRLYEHGLQSLSHIITYLNDRECWFLRAAFFDVVFAAAAQISRQAAREYIVPLINLADHEPFVVVSALRALVRLAPQMSPAMVWDKLVEVQAQPRAAPPLRRAADEFARFVLASAALPLPPDAARLALDLASVAQPPPPPPPARDRQADRAPPAGDRLVRLRDIDAALRTEFLTPVADPWAAGEQSGGAGFLRRKALELPLPAPPEPQAQAAWRPRGLVAAEIAEHSDCVTCAVSAGGALFATGSDDGTVRVFDGGAARRAVACRSRATHAQGGRITALAFHAALGCLVSASDNGTVHVMRPDCRVLAAAALPAGEHAVALAFARDAVVVAATSRARAVFLGVAALRELGAVDLDAALGRPTCVASDGAALAVVATADGALHLVDTRFRVRLRAYRHFLGHRIVALAMRGADSVLAATAAGDVCVLSLPTGRWPVCVCSRSLQQLKANETTRRLRINALARIPASQCFVTGSNDGLVRYWDPAAFDRSYVVNSPEPAPPYSSYRLNDTVYYCENPAPARPAAATGAGASASASASAAIAANSSIPSGPITAIAVLPSDPPMLVAGLQGGAVRILL
ncbi:hypothetical protein H4R18_004818 [Coemansia javaensis]|uniref:non-specific serine/threonine protein kinase n=1 Tax=Coemansia javaensis TaxID=2761396 RepID=A0A9W8LGI6_9FUNG|nr:hypothetical protein H4R18_004818 [Coemansia javaensis]